MFPGGGGPSIVEVPGDGRPHGILLWTSSLAKGMIFGSFSGF